MTCRSTFTPPSESCAVSSSSAGGPSTTSTPTTGASTPGVSEPHLALYKAYHYGQITRKEWEPTHNFWARLRELAP